MYLFCIANVGSLFWPQEISTMMNIDSLINLTETEVYLTWMFAEYSDVLVSLCSVYILCTLTLVNLSCRCSQITLDTQNRMVGEVKGRPLGSILAMTTQGTANSTDSALRNLMSILWYSPLKPSPAFTQKLLLVIVFSKSKSDHHSFPNKLELLFHYSFACRVGHIMQQLFSFFSFSKFVWLMLCSWRNVGCGSIPMGIFGTL